jgi:hypothetical protein
MATNERKNWLRAKGSSGRQQGYFSNSSSISSSFSRYRSLSHALAAHYTPLGAGEAG